MLTTSDWKGEYKAGQDRNHVQQRNSYRKNKVTALGKLAESPYLRQDHAHSLFTRGSKLSTCDSGNRDRANKASRQAQQGISVGKVAVRGLTLEDYVRGRSSSEQQRQTNSINAKNSHGAVIRLKQEDQGLCFQRNFQIEEEDEDDYSEHHVDEQSGMLPVLEPRSRRGPKHIQTEAYEEQHSPKQYRPTRLMTSYNQELFLPIHSLGRQRAQMRLSFHRRQQRSQSNNQKEEDVKLTCDRIRDVNALAKHSLNYKTNTLSDFYKVSEKKSLSKIDREVRIDLGFATKYSQKFRLNPVLETRRQHNKHL